MASKMRFIENGKKIVGAGINYNEVLKLHNLQKPKNPVIFFKPTTSYIEEGQTIIIPEGFSVFEEIELGVIIGRDCKNVSENEALDYVGGYCLALDLTAMSEINIARENGLPWSLGKGFDTACPVSRKIRKSEITNPGNVQLWVKVNNKMCQESSTSDLTFSVPQIISYVSKYIKLERDDLILTGTPPGMTEIKSGDFIEGGINGVITMKFNVQ